MKATDSSNHSKFAQIAGVAPQLTAVLARGVGAKPAPGRQMDDSVLSAIVTTPATLLDVPIRITSER